MFNLIRALFLCGICVCGYASAMHLTVDNSELNRKAEAVLLKTPGYEGVLDSEKFIDSPEERKRMRTDIAKKIISKGQDFFTSYTVSRSGFFFFVKRRIDSNFDPNFTTEYEKIKAVDYYIGMVNSGTERALVPILFLSYYYCNRWALNELEKLDTK
jgi:hypothetical protein